MMGCQYKKKNSYSYEISSSMDGALLEMMCGICQRQRSAGCAFLPIETPLENEEYFGGMCKKGIMTDAPWSLLRWEKFFVPYMTACFIWARSGEGCPANLCIA